MPYAPTTPHPAFGHLSREERESTALLPPLTKDERLRDREEQKRQKREESPSEEAGGDRGGDRPHREGDQPLEAEMNSPGFFDDPERGAEAGERHAALNARLESCMGMGGYVRSVNPSP